MFFAGLDYSKRFSVATVLDVDGKTVKKGRFPNRRSEFIRFFQSYRPLSVVTEAGRNWHVVIDLLEGLVDEIKLAHPYKVKAIAEARIKTDAIDSETLAHLLRTNLIPEAYLRPRESREEQMTLRTRCFYVKLRTKVRNKIHHLLDGQSEEIREEGKRYKDVFGQKGKQWLQGIRLAKREKHTLDNLMELEEMLCTKIKQSDGFVKELFEENSDCKLLQSIPGFGVFLSVLTKTEISNVNRFADSAHLACYAGIVPSTYSSGGRTFHGRIVKGGNKWLRWAFIEAAIHAAQSPGELKRFYNRIKRKKGTKIARVATARKLCSIVYRILTERTPHRIYGRLPSRLRVATSGPL
jgi:transposase